MKELNYYANMLLNGEIHYKDSKDAVKVNDCNLKGYSLELAVKDYYGLPLEISRSRQNDIIFYDADDRKHFMEVKSNSSPIDGVLGRSSFISYAAFVNLDATLAEQVGYVMKLKTFMDIGMTLGHIKSGTTKGGTVEVEYKTQTVYNNTKSEFHGKKWFKLEAEYVRKGGISFEDWFI